MSIVSFYILDDNKISFYILISGFGLFFVGRLQLMSHVVKEHKRHVDENLDYIEMEEHPMHN